MKLFLTQFMLWALPVIAFAQANAPVHGVKGLFLKALVIIDQLASIIFAFALLFFLWNIVVYLISSGKSEARAEAARFMLWGIIVLAVMVGVGGAITIMLETSGFSRSGYFLPQFKY